MVQNRIEREGFRVFTCSDDHCSWNNKVPVQSVILALSHHALLCLAVGKPIEVQKTPYCSQEEVDRLHQRYIKELEKSLRSPQAQVQRPQRPTLGDLLKATQRRGASKMQDWHKGWMEGRAVITEGFLEVSVEHISRAFTDTSSSSPCQAPGHCWLLGEQTRLWHQ